MSKKLTPNLEGWNRCTELCVDVKTFLLNDRITKMGKAYKGLLIHDAKDHFSFIETAPKKEVPTTRNPQIFKGSCINVNQNEDGSLRPTFNRPRYSEVFTFRDFCRAAARELLIVSDLVEE